MTALFVTIFIGIQIVSLLIIELEVPFFVEDGRIMPGTTNGKESTLFRIVVTDISGRARARK